MNNFPSMGIGGGRIAVFWSDFKNGDYPSNVNEDVWSTVSTDGGANWNTPTLVSNQGDIAAQYFPWGSVGQKGHLYVMYYDRRYGSCGFSRFLDANPGTSAHNRRNFVPHLVSTQSLADT